jgi:hypothetical protein
MQAAKLLQNYYRVAKLFIAGVRPAQKQVFVASPAVPFSSAPVEPGASLPADDMMPK